MSLAVANLLGVKLTVGVGRVVGAEANNPFLGKVADQKEDMSPAGWEVLCPLGSGG